MNTKNPREHTQWTRKTEAWWVTGVLGEIELNDFESIMLASVWIHKHIEYKLRSLAVYVCEFLYVRPFSHCDFFCLIYQSGSFWKS